MSGKLYKAPLAVAESPAAPPRVLRHGWLMVALSFIVQAVGIGNQYVVAVLIEPLRHLLQISTAAVMMATLSAMSIVAILASPLCGRLMQRHSLRRFIVAAFAAVALGYAALAFVTALWQVALIFAIAFATGTLAGSVAATTLVSNWFVERRGTAQGIASAGIHCAGCLMPPAAAWALDAYGWQVLCLLAALAAAALLPLAAALIIDTPEAKGWSPLGSPPPQPAGTAAPVPDKALTLGELLASGSFWLAAAVAAFSSGAGGILVVYLVEIARTAGIDRLHGAYLVSCATFSAMVGAVLFGKLFDRLGRPAMVQLTLALSAAPCLLLFGTPVYPLLVVASVLVGLSLGASMLIPTVLAALHFGRGGFATAIGGINACMMLFLIVGLPWFGWVYDSYGSYDIGLLSLLALLAATAAVAALILRKPA